MKRVERLSVEPAGLAAYRRNNSVDAQAPPDESSGVWRRFRNDPAYKEVLRALTVAQQGLCVFCEQRLVDANGEHIFNDYQVEHVLPKSGAAGATLDWQNLALACGGGTSKRHQDRARRGVGKAGESCGQCKGNGALATGCDPRSFPPATRFLNVGIDGTLSPNSAECQRHGLTEADLEATIHRMLNLNCERLRLAREEVGANVRAWLVPLLNELLTNTHLDVQQKRQFSDLLRAGRLQADSNGYLRAFWTTERCALEAP